MMSGGSVFDKGKMDGKTEAKAMKAILQRKGKEIQGKIKNLRQSNSVSALRYQQELEQLEKRCRFGIGARFDVDTQKFGECLSELEKLEASILEHLEASMDYEAAKYKPKRGVLDWIRGADEEGKERKERERISSLAGADDEWEKRKQEIERERKEWERIASLAGADDKLVEIRMKKRREERDRGLQKLKAGSFAEGYPVEGMEDTGWECTNCGAVNGVDSIVCWKCGRRRPLDEYFGECPVCKRDNRSGTLSRDKQGHIVCSNSKCPAHDPRYRASLIGGRPSTFGLELGASLKSGDNVLFRKSVPVGRNFVNTARDRLRNTFHPFKVRDTGINAREGDDRAGERDRVKEDAIENFRHGYIYKEAVERQIGTYDGRGWWDRNRASELNLQQKEVKAIIWDVYQHPEKHHISRKEIYDSPGMKDAHNSVRGLSGVSGRAKIHMGNWTNRGNLGKISNLQTRLAKLEGERDYLGEELEKPEVANNEVRFRTVKAQFDVKKSEVDETLRKIEDVEKYPELGKRNFAGAGRWFKAKSKSLRDVKDKTGGKIVNGYSALKAKTSGALSLFFAMIIFAAMLVLTWTAGDAYFPINAWQVVTFLVLTILIALIKISLSEDKSAEQEAKEITGLIILAGTIIAIIIGIKLGNGFSWGSLIFCIICGLYVFFDFMTDSVIVSFMLFAGMCFLVYFTMTGWMDMVGVQAEKLAIETGFDEAIETSLHSISDGASDVWLMLSDPNAWFQKKQTEKDMAKAEGQTKKALEITGATMWPGTVNMGETANLVVEVENFGDKEAKNAEVYVRVDEDDQGHIDVRGYNDGKDKASRYLGNVLSDATARHAFTISAPPDCVGTFKLTCGVSYEYDVVATGDIAVISKDRFEELRRQGKMKSTRHVTTSGGGPVSVNVQTDKDEPIPVLLADEVGDGSGTATEVQVHITVHNHGAGSGTLRLTDMVVKMPEGFEIHKDATGEDDAERDCGLVVFLEDDGEVDDDYEYYHVKAFGGDGCGEYIGDGGASAGGGGEELGGGADPEEGEEAEDEESGDEIDNCNLLEDRKMFMCDMTYTPPVGAKLSFPKHLPFMVDISYDYSYERTTSFSVKAGFLKKDEKPKKCKDGGDSSSGDGESGDKKVCEVTKEGDPSGISNTYAQFTLDGEGPESQWKVEKIESTGGCVSAEEIEYAEGSLLKVNALPSTPCSAIVTITYESDKTCKVTLNVPAKDSLPPG